ncbi:MAG TPA: hypothetical protein VEG08_06745 [Terriglobales bacterium]|nr:hypothetical protein [Terriglobales bacterium]
MMLTYRLVRLIESHSEQLAHGLLEKVHSSERTTDFRKIPAAELEVRVREIYQNLGDWLLRKTEADIQRRYNEIGARRASQGVRLSQMIWAIIGVKEHLWEFLKREGLVDRPVELLSELELFSLLDQFFDRAIYHATVGYEQVFADRGKARGAERRHGERRGVTAVHHQHW